MTVEEEDSDTEAQRFGALLAVLLETVPELGGWWAESTDGLPRPMTLCDAGIEAGIFHLFDEDDQLRHVNTVWPRMLRFIELALRVEDILWSDDTREADAVTIDAFAGCGLVHDLTRTRASIEKLLPWMGPETVESARREVELHWRSRGFGVEDVDWGTAGTAFVALDHRPEDLVPTRW